MALKTYNPTTPGQRQLVNRRPLGPAQGRAGQGADRRPDLDRRPQQQRPHHRRASAAAATSRPIARSTSSARKFDVPATVERIEYDPNRTAFIALIKYQDGELAYILAPQRLSPGDTVVAGEHVDVKPGNAMPLGNMPVGTIVHNIEIKIGKGGQIARSAGSYAQIVGRDQDYVILRLNSAEQRLVHGRCMATVGAVSNPDNMNTVDRQGRPQALEGPRAAQPRHRP